MEREKVLRDALFIVLILLLGHISIDVFVLLTPNNVCILGIGLISSAVAFIVILTMFGLLKKK